MVLPKSTLHRTSLSHVSATMIRKFELGSAEAPKLQKAQSKYEAHSAHNPKHQKRTKTATTTFGTPKLHTAQSTETNSGPPTTSGLVHTYVRLCARGGGANCRTLCVLCAAFVDGYVHLCAPLRPPEQCMCIQVCVCAHYVRGYVRLAG